MSDYLTGSVWLVLNIQTRLDFYQGVLVFDLQMGDPPDDTNPGPDPTQEPQERVTFSYPSYYESGTEQFHMKDGVCIPTSPYEEPHTPPEEPQPRFTGTKNFTRFEGWDPVTEVTQSLTFQDGVLVDASPGLVTNETENPSKPPPP